MKKIVFSLVLLSIVLLGFTQNQPPLEDGSFETKWEYITDAPSPFWDYSLNDEEDLFQTLNGLYMIPPTDGITTKLTAFRESDAQHGNYAIKLVSTNFPGFGTTGFVPGAFGTITNDYIETYLAEGFIDVKMPYIFKPLGLSGYYKYVPVNGDSAVIEMALYNEDIKTMEGYKKLKNQVNQWTEFTVWQNEAYPGAAQANVTHLRLLFISSAGYNFNDLEACAGQLGSALYIDNLRWEYTQGLQENMLNSVKTSVFPNPSVENVFFLFDKELQGELVIYNMSGQEMMSIPVDGCQTQCSVTDLEAGNYLFRVINGKQILSKGKFAVTL